ncbi:TetR/AcrR family transcriptional regulator [Pseudoruegeria sp. HB172150]|uniref:TetR/AcrR family transcriptional regulator n=1 Tax=Pseudoruegeria sp. HB172150 TaxID=2721164 RepID=UPI0015559078|nr:TetR/AcrR family transcriptional regulator [Pseudoruegeria sp. HB172150]
MPRRAATAEKPMTRKRRDEVFDAAARVFAERGYHGASTQDIADLLGMRQASLYYYFHSKEAALEEVCARGTAGFIERAEAILKSDEDQGTKLHLLLAAQVMPMAEGADYVQTFLNERKWLPTESRRRIGRMSRRIEAIFERVIRDGIRAGEFRQEINPRLATLGLLGMMNSVAAWHDRESAGLEKIAEALSNLVIGGIRQPEGSNYGS